MTRILLVGYDPDAVDFSDPALPPDMTAEKIRAGIAAALKQFAARGWPMMASFGPMKPPDGRSSVCWLRPEQTSDGDDLVVFVVRVFRGESEGVKLQDRLEAATWLADRGLGKPTQGVELAGKDGEPLLSLALVQAVVADAERAGTD